MHILYLIVFCVYIPATAATTFNRQEHKVNGRADETSWVSCLTSHPRLDAQAHSHTHARTYRWSNPWLSSPGYPMLYIEDMQPYHFYCLFRRVVSCEKCIIQIFAIAYTIVGNFTLSCDNNSIYISFPRLPKTIICSTCARFFLNILRWFTCYGFLVPSGVIL